MYNFSKEHAFLPFGKNACLFMRAFWGSMTFASQQTKPCVFRCVASVTHFFICEVGGMDNNDSGFPFLRRIDEVGRIVIPKDLRRVLGWEANTPVILRVENGNLVIKTLKED